VRRAPRRVSILCVDDNPEIIEAVRMMLERRRDCEWAGSLERADDLVGFARARDPDIVLLDIDMPGRDPFDVVFDLASHCPDARVIMLSGHVRKDLVSRAIKAGAWGYVAKRDGGQALLHAIEQVIAGEFAMSAEAGLSYAL
jgi:DNA-binding NarL/FixJ family response regulator